MLKVTYDTQIHDNNCNFSAERPCLWKGYVCDKKIEYFFYYCVVQYGIISPNKSLKNCLLLCYGVDENRPKYVIIIVI